MKISTKVTVGLVFIFMAFNFTTVSNDSVNKRQMAQFSVTVCVFGSFHSDQ